MGGQPSGRAAGRRSMRLCLSRCGLPSRRFALLTPRPASGIVSDTRHSPADDRDIATTSGPFLCGIQCGGVPDTIRVATGAWVPSSPVQARLSVLLPYDGQSAIRLTPGGNAKQSHCAGCLAGRNEFATEGEPPSTHPVARALLRLLVSLPREGAGVRRLRYGLIRFGYSCYGLWGRPVRT